MIEKNHLKTETWILKGNTLYKRWRESGIIHNLKAKITQMSINWWMVNKPWLQPYYGILFHHKEKWSAWYTWYNMDEPWKHDKQKEPVTKDHKRSHLCDMASKQTQRQKKGCRGLEEGRMRSDC